MREVRGRDKHDWEQKTGTLADAIAILKRNLARKQFLLDEVQAAHQYGFANDASPHTSSIGVEPDPDTLTKEPDAGLDSDFGAKADRE